MASLGFMFQLTFFLVCSSFSLGHEHGLKLGFYKTTCPNVEDIVKEVVDQVIHEAPRFAAPLLRMHFHDCFVRGCDGSVLLDSPTHTAEKDAPPNQSIIGFEIIDKVKTAVEKACPGVVSCADILALVARDVIAAIKGPYWKAETGRKDGRISSMQEASNEIISPASNISALKQKFQKRGLSVKDLVVLSGSHTIGVSHCTSFTCRLYNTGNCHLDPKLDPNYAAELKKKCKLGDQSSIVEMDPGSSLKFDVSYYTNVARRRGLFQSDAALLDDNETKAYLENQSLRNGPTFFEDFGVSMVNMGRIGVLTGNEGEIRKVCTKVN